MILEVVVVMLLGLMPVSLVPASEAPAESSAFETLELHNETEHFQFHEVSCAGGKVGFMGLRPGDSSSFKLPCGVAYTHIVEQVPCAYLKNISQNKVVVANGYGCFIGVQARGFPYLLKIIDPFSIAIIDVTGFWWPATMHDLDIVTDVRPGFNYELTMVRSPDGSATREMYAERQSSSVVEALFDALVLGRRGVSDVDARDSDESTK